MKRLFWMPSVIGLFSACLISTLAAQPPGPRGGDRPEGRGERGGFRGQGGPEGRGGPMGGGGPGMMQALPVMAALDADKNGTISSSEIKNAVAALKKLDKNGDGQLTFDELRPTPPAMGDRPGRGPRDEGDRGPRGGGERGPRGDRAGGFGGPEMMAQLFTRMDKDSDGKLTGDEIPERMSDRLSMIDTDGDGSISKAEMESAASKMQGRGGRGGDRGGEGRPGGDRPRRPAAEE